MESYFDLLEQTLLETGLTDYPALLFNMDETGFAYDPPPGKTVDLQGGKVATFHTSGPMEQSESRKVDAYL